MVENENKNWYLPDFWNKKCDFSYFCWSQIFHLRNEDAGLDCKGPFLFRLMWGKKREVGSRRGQKENSISFNKACSQGGHFPFSINPCPSWGHFHPDVPPIVSATFHCEVWMCCCQRQGGSGPRPHFPRCFLLFLPLEDLEPPLLLGHPATGPEYVTLDGRIFKLPTPG